MKPGLTIFFIKNTTVVFDNLKSFWELFFPVLLYHIILEFFEFTRGNVNHLLLSFTNSSPTASIIVHLCGSVFLTFTSGRETSATLLAVWSLRYRCWYTSLGRIVIGSIVQLIDIIHVHMIENIRILPIFRCVTI